MNPFIAFATTIFPKILKAITPDPTKPQATAATPAAPKPGDGSFDACMKFVLQYEGGFCNNPKDPGGATNYGITLATLEHWRSRNCTPQDVKNLTVAEACEIYRAGYWDTMKCDLLPKGVDLMVFDFGVNAGPKRSVQYLQKAAGADPDGGIGPITLQAVASQDPKDLIVKLAADRMSFYRTLPTWSTFGKGWTNRVEAARKEALRMRSSVRLAA